MSSADRLEPMLGMARRHAEQAARELGQALTRLEQIQQQMADLLRYRDDYGLELGRTMAGGVRAAQMLGFRQMLERLDSALTQQRKLLADQVALCDLARRRYLERRARVQALDDLIHSRRAAEQSRQAMREQRMLDDLTQARWRRAESCS
ncbi:MAG TPA: flagellar export protein FliJ [Candidatus Acidoferrales bacterium]|nr:flagellar export protein FliJ [Candidatus Acidoferrales bacterium]